MMNQLLINISFNLSTFFASSINQSLLIQIISLNLSFSSFLIFHREYKSLNISHEWSSTAKYLQSGNMIQCDHKSNLDLESFIMFSKILKFPMIKNKNYINTLLKESTTLFNTWLKLTWRICRSWKLKTPWNIEPMHKWKKSRIQTRVVIHTFFYFYK